MDRISARSRVEGTLRAPSSKSYAQRALAAALLSEGVTVLRNMGLCDDTEAALRVALALGARCEAAPDGDLIIYGGLKDGKLSPVETTLDARESGLSARMFAPIAALCGCETAIKGHGTLLSRPFGMLVEPLRELGVRMRTGAGGRLPLTIDGRLAGGTARIDGSLSSQFVTGLLMALPLAEGDSTLLVADPVSTPYIDMTLGVLDAFGVEVSCNCEHTEFFIHGRQRYVPPTPHYNVEGDWSGASCLLVAGAIAGEITVENLDPLSLQADAAIIDVLSRAGAEITTGAGSVTVRRRRLDAFRFDATHCPDLFPALAALAAACDGVSEIRGTRRLVEKESDRAVALADVYGCLGIEVDNDTEDVMKIRGGRVRSAVVESRGDHRVAMSAAVAGLVSDGGVTVRGAEAVSKSYPAFWDDLDSVCR